MVITETWLSSEMESTDVTPEGYSCFRKDRCTGYYAPWTYQISNRGGVLILAKNNLNPMPYSEGDVEAEIIWISINPNPSLTYG